MKTASFVVFVRATSRANTLNRQQMLRMFLLLLNILFFWAKCHSSHRERPMNTVTAPLMSYRRNACDSDGYWHCACHMSRDKRSYHMHVRCSVTTTCCSMFRVTVVEFIVRECYMNTESAFWKFYLVQYIQNILIEYHSTFSTQVNLFRHFTMHSSICCSSCSCFVPTKMYSIMEKIVRFHIPTPTHSLRSQYLNSVEVLSFVGNRHIFLSNNWFKASSKNAEIQIFVNRRWFAISVLFHQRAHVHRNLFYSS